LYFLWAEQPEVAQCHPEAGLLQLAVAQRLDQAALVEVAVEQQMLSRGAPDFPSRISIVPSPVITSTACPSWLKRTVP